MSFKKIVEYLDKIEAVTNYEKITKENSNLKRMYNDQQKRIQDLENEVKKINDYRIQYGYDVYTEADFRKLVGISVNVWKKRELAKKVKKKWDKEKDRLIKETIQRYFNNYPVSCPENIQVIFELKVHSEVKRILRARTRTEAKKLKPAPPLRIPVRVVERPNLQENETEEEEEKKNP